VLQLDWVTVYQEELLWCCADTLGKIFFSSTLLHSNFMSIEHRRMMAMRVVEEANRCGCGGWPGACLGVMLEGCDGASRHCCTASKPLALEHYAAVSLTWPPLLTPLHPSLACSGASHPKPLTPQTMPPSLLLPPKPKFCLKPSLPCFPPCPSPL
jgi:hypothetical protein